MLLKIPLSLILPLRLSLTLVFLCASVSPWPSSLFLSSLIFSMSLCKNPILLSFVFLCVSVPLWPYL